MNIYIYYSYFTLCKADSKELKEIWVLNIYLAICECVGEGERGVGWRHHYMLGKLTCWYLYLRFGLH